MLGGNIESLCGTINASCDSLTAMTTASVSVTIPPVDELSPEVSINAPSLVSHGQDFVIDIASSYGAFGRPWASATLTISGTNDRAIQPITNILTTLQYTFEPILIEGKYFSEGQYVIKANLCNYLGGCQMIVTSFYVRPPTWRLPYIVLGGPTQKSILPRTPLRVSGIHFQVTNESSIIYKDSVSPYWMCRKQGSK